MGVESVSVVRALSHADTLEISYHFPTRVLLPALESMESKRHTSYRSYSTNVYIQNHWSTALKLLGKTERTQIALSPETPWTLYNYIYLEDNTAYGAKYYWHNWALFQRSSSQTKRISIRGYVRWGDFLLEINKKWRLTKATIQLK